MFHSIPMPTVCDSVSWIVQKVSKGYQSVHLYRPYVGANEGLLYRSGCLAVHRVLTVHHLVRVSVSLRVKFKVRVRDMVKLKFMDHG